MLDQLLGRCHLVGLVGAVPPEEVRGKVDPVPHRAAEQIVHGSTRRLALDVETRKLDRRKPLRQILVEGTLGRVVRHPSESLDLERVLSDEPFAQGGDQRVTRRTAPSNLTKAGDPLVGVDLDERSDEPCRVDAVAVAKRCFQGDGDGRRSDVGDLQRRPPRRLRLGESTTTMSLCQGDCGSSLSDTFRWRWSTPHLRRTARSSEPSTCSSCSRITASWVPRRSSACSKRRSRPRSGCWRSCTRVASWSSPRGRDVTGWDRPSGRSLLGPRPRR